MFKYLEEKFNGDESHHLVKSIDALNEEAGNYIWSGNDLTYLDTFQQIQKCSREEQKLIILEISKIVGVFAEKWLQAQAPKLKLHQTAQLYHKRITIATALQSRLLQRKLDYSESEWMELMKSFRDSIDSMPPNNHYLFMNGFPVNRAIKQIEYYLKKNEGSKKLKGYIKKVLDWKDLNNEGKNYYSGNDLLKASANLKSLLADTGEIYAFNLKTEDIGPEVNKVITSISKDKEIYNQLFALAEKVNGGKPTSKFTETYKPLQEKIGIEKFRKVLHEILTIPVNQPIATEAKTHTYEDGTTYTFRSGDYLCSPSQNFIKGMVWMAERFSDKKTIQLLNRICEKAYTKIPGKGPAAAALGNACVYVLGNMRGKEGLGALSRLKLKVRQNNVKKTIDKYLAIGAEKYNVSVEELKEMAVPDFHLTDGQKSIAFDDYKLTITLVGAKAVQQWIKPDGSPMKSVPSKVKNSDSLKKKLATTRKEVKEIQKVFTAQKQRIDNQFIVDRKWGYAAFSKYYLDHGLVAPIAKKLIWSFKKGKKKFAAIYLDQKWTTVDGVILDWINDETEVQLWHPIYADQKTIVDWREKIIALEWKQAVKQAFREIYILTDAEINTNVYSNRMAAHILKQHQFNVLANLRDWKYSLMGWYDDGRDNEICYKYLAQYKITAQFWIDELAQDDAYNDTGIWHYISTDQVKFIDENEEPIELSKVPVIVFTEIMRDVDMFVGVCSVGNDPQWMDNNGARQENRNYWNSYSFGNLSEIAKTRKTILERLLPRLSKIRDIAHIDGRFLVVKGKIRTYKIHIGSGNILMEPNDQYLCIVQARSADKSTDKIFIPFEGDKGLSMVLSKAFLLAADDKISDTTITSQIER